MATRSVTYAWDEAPELDEAGAPTGAVVVTVTTASHPDGYPVILPGDADDFARAATVAALWAAQGRP